VVGAEARQQVLERKHLLDGREVPRDRADPALAVVFEPPGDRLERLVPRRRTQPAVLAHERLVEALHAQTIDDLAGLVGNPLLVHAVR